MKHYIIVKWKDSVEGEKMLPAIRQLFQGTIDLDGVNGVEMYHSNSDRSNRYDLMIKMDLTPGGLTEFDHSKIHQDWKAEYGQYIEQKAIFDCE